MKLLWLVDRYHLMMYGRPALDATYVAMRHGPVPSEIMNVTRNTEQPYARNYLRAEGYNVFSLDKPDISLFSKSEIKALEKVKSLFGEMPPFELRDLSHEYPEWKRFENTLEKQNTSIPMKIEDFFTAPTTKESKFEVFDVNKDQLEYAKYLYKSQHDWSEALHELAVDREERRKGKKVSESCLPVTH